MRGRTLFGALFTSWAMLFVIFDVETMFPHFPWAILYKGWVRSAPGSLSRLVFDGSCSSASLLVGYLWLYKKGPLLSGA